MKIFLVAHKNSSINYFQLRNLCEDLTFVFKTPVDLNTDIELCDIITIEQETIESATDLNYFKKMVSFSKVLLILSESKAYLANDYLSLGIKDIFIPPINLIELATKLKRATQANQSTLLNNFKSGMSLTQMLILEILEMNSSHGVTRDHILQEIWGNEKVEPKNVDVQIHYLRKILKKRGKEIQYWQKRWFLK